MLRILYILPGETSMKSGPRLTHLTFNNGHIGLGSLPETASFLLLPFSAFNLLAVGAVLQMSMGDFRFESLETYQSQHGAVETNRGGSTLGDDCLPRYPTFSELHAFRGFYSLYSPDLAWPGVWH